MITAYEIDKARELINSNPDVAAFQLARFAKDYEDQRKVIHAIQALSQNPQIVLTGNRKALEFALGRKIED
jgi:hypothetical protein